MADAHKNFAYGVVTTAPSPATTGTTLSITTGAGALFPAVPFNATVWPATGQPLASTAEIVRVTNIAGDDFTITRAQEGTTARNIAPNWQIAATVTAKSLTDIETDLVTATTVLDATALTVTNNADPTVSLRWDASNRLDIAVQNTGIIDFTPVGSAARIRIGVLFQHTGSSCSLSDGDGADADVTVGSGAQAGYGANLRIRGPAGQLRKVQFTSADAPRWKLGANGAAESGSDAGSAFVITACVDAGTENDNVLSITRATNGTIAWEPSRPMTGGTYNGQTISSSANFTGTVVAATSVKAPSFIGPVGANLSVVPDTGYDLTLTASTVTASGALVLNTASSQVAIHTGLAAGAYLLLGTPSMSFAQIRMPGGSGPSSPTTGDFWYEAGVGLKFRDDGGTTRTITWT